ncbi:MAG: hypothetical protein COA58_15680 [Bacteroidetes bacterium]|nr:MAG: hypothetical protein COA58_15680 [Bacteroidota bacterium]
MSNEIENIFQEKFKNFESTPSAGLFDAIQAKRKKKRRVIWIWSAAAILFLSTGIGFSLLKDQNNNSISTDDTPTTESANTNLESKNTTLSISPIDEQTDITIESTFESEQSTNSKVEFNLEAKPINSENYVIHEMESPISSETPILDKPDSPISNQELATLFKKIASENKGADITKAKVFTRKGKTEVDIIVETKAIEGSEANIPETKDEDIANVTEANNEEKNKTTTPPPTHKLVKLSRWSIEATSSIGLGGRTISGATDYVSLRNLTESARISNSFTLSGIYQLDPKWNIQTGFILLNRNENFNHSTNDYVQYNEREEQRTETIIHPVLGEIERTYTVVVTDTIVTSGIKTNNINKHTLLSIPLILERELMSNNKWSVMSKGGVMVSIYTNSQGNIVNESNQVSLLETAGVKTSGTYSALFGLGTMYKASDRVSILLYPQVNFGLNSSFENRLAFKQREIGIYTHLGLRVRL